MMLSEGCRKTIRTMDTSICHGVQYSRVQHGFLPTMHQVHNVYFHGLSETMGKLQSVNKPEINVGNGTGQW